VGITQYFTPGLYGGVDNAKKLYKYHRLSGYIVLLLMLATVAAATQTTYNIGTLHIQLWAVVVASLIVVVGILPRIRLNKFGWLAGN
jgi:membrane protein YdbS with pleckstrin-like domain